MSASEASGSPSGPGRTSFRRAIRGNVLALGVVSLLTDVSSDMMIPLLPLFVTALGAGPVFVGLMEGVRESASSFFKLFSGWFSDRIGKKKILIALGYGISTLVKPLVALARIPLHVLAFTCVERVGKGLRTAPRDALIADSAPSDARGRAYSFHRAMDHTGAVGGLLLAGLLLYLLAPAVRNRGGGPVDVYRLVFFIATIPALLAVITVCLFVRERGAAALTVTRRGPRWKAEGFERRFWLLLGILVLFSLGNSSDGFLVLRAREVLKGGAVLAPDMGTGGWRIPWEIPLMLVVLSVSKALFSLPGGALADRFGKGPLLVAGWIVYGAVYVGFGFARSPWHVWSLFAAYGLFFGFTEGVEKAIVADFAPAGKRATAFGFYSFADGMAKFPASLIMGLLYATVGVRFAFCFGAALAALAAVLLCVLLEGRRKVGPHGL